MKLKNIIDAAKIALEAEDKAKDKDKKEKRKPESPVNT